MNNKSLVCIVFGIFVVLAWYMGIGNATASSSGYNSYIRSAEKYEKEELYQLAITDYSSALTYEDTLKVRMKICELYRLGMENGEITNDGNYVSFLLDTMSTYAKEADGYEEAAQYFYSVLDYDNLISTLQTAADFGVKTKKITEIDTAVKYLYEKHYSTFSKPVHLNFGYYLIKDTGNQYSMDTNLNVHLDNNEFIAPYSSDGRTVAKRDGRVFIVGSDSVRQKYLDENISASSGIADGNIACKVNDKWSYFDTEGKKLSGDYIYASRFCAGVAAVQEKEGEWRLINTKYEYLTDAVYEDIILDASENCSSNGIILAKQNGKYSILTINGYDPSNPDKVKLKDVKGFSCDACELPIDPSIGSNNGEVWFAYKSGNKWGFADCEGKVKIEPKFADAKSFANGYAGVSEDGEKWNFADTKGNVVIKTQASDVGYFGPNGVCMVKFDLTYWTYISMYYWAD